MNYKKYIMILALLAIFIQCRSQDYTGSVGFRGGLTWGPNFKAFMNENHAIEGIVSFRDRGMQFNFLLEKYRPLLLETTDNFYVFYGYGAHAGYVRYYDDLNSQPPPNGPYQYKYTASPVLGADAIVGIEYRIYKYPFAFTFDYKPFFEFFGQPFFRINIADFALTARYTFK